MFLYCPNNIDLVIYYNVSYVISYVLDKCGHFIFIEHTHILYYFRGLSQCGLTGLLMCPLNHRQPEKAILNHSCSSPNLEASKSRERSFTCTGVDWLCQIPPLSVLSRKSDEGTASTASMVVTALEISMFSSEKTKAVIKDGQSRNTENISNIVHHKIRNEIYI